MTHEQNLEKFQKDIRRLYNVKSVRNGYDYWFNVLLNKATGFCKWENLPDTMFSQIIESNLLTSGFSVIFDSKYGIISNYQLGGYCTASVYGFDVYGRPTEAIVANPMLPGINKFSIFPNYELSNRPRQSKKCAVIYNSWHDSMNPNTTLGLLYVLQRYARMLADIESSIAIATRNTRMNGIMTASNQQDYANILAAFRKVDAGDDVCVSVGNNILTDVKQLVPNSVSSLMELLQARDKVLGWFLWEIAINFMPEKRERMIVAESGTNTQHLLINIDDLIDQRKRDAENVNKLFGLNIEAKLNEDYDPTRFIVDDFNVETEEIVKNEDEGDDSNDNI